MKPKSIWQQKLTRRAALAGGVLAGGLSLYGVARTGHAETISVGSGEPVIHPTHHPIQAFTGGPLIPVDADTIIHVVSDSLGDQQTETIYKMALDLATDHPTLGVEYRLWQVDKGSYAPPVTLQPSGRHMITIYNFAVGGSQPARLFGRDRALGLDPIDADIVVWQHGKNVSSEQSPDGRMQSAFEMYRLKNPRAVNVAILEPPNRDDDKMAAMNDAIRRLAAEYGDIVIVDSYTPWIEARKPTQCYVNNLHPNAFGVDSYSRPAIRQAMKAARRPARVTPARLLAHGPNILTNGAFAEMDNGLPTGWVTSGGALIVSRDSERKTTGRQFSLKLGQSAIGGSLRQAFTSDQAKAISGEFVWFAALMFVDVGAAPSAGLIQLFIADEIGTQHIGVPHTRDMRPSAEPTGRWAWCIGRTQRRVGESVDAAQSSLKIFVDSAAADTQIWVDRVVLGTGEIPHDMLV